jgi:hypothetical protein
MKIGPAAGEQRDTVGGSIDAVTWSRRGIALADPPTLRRSLVRVARETVRMK